MNFLSQAICLDDVIKIQAFGFHNLKNKLGRDLNGYYSIYVKSKIQAWRIVLQPLDENNKPYDSNKIEQFSKRVKVIKIMEVSKHYE